MGLAFALGGCAQVERVLPAWGKASPPEGAGEEAGMAAESVPRAPVKGPQTPAALDTTTAKERAAAAAPKTSGAKDLGLTIASLGAPSEPGFWLKTPLVKAPAKGRLDYGATGKSVAVDLIPLAGAEGAGSRMSLAAFRLLEAPLTGLPEVRVFQLP
jgi:hypothetical protein